MAPVRQRRRRDEEDDVATPYPPCRSVPPASPAPPPRESASIALGSKEHEEVDVVNYYYPKYYGKAFSDTMDAMKGPPKLFGPRI